MGGNRGSRVTGRESKVTRGIFAIIVPLRFSEASSSPLYKPVFGD